VRELVGLGEDGGWHRVGSLEAAPELSIGYFFPSPDAWKGGDRTITCYLARTDQGPMSNSLRSSGGG